MEVHFGQATRASKETGKSSGLMVGYVFKGNSVLPLVSEAVGRKVCAVAVVNVVVRRR